MTRILLIEDSLNANLHAQDLLKAAGYTVYGITDFYRLEPHLECSPRGHYDVVLSDYYLDPNAPTITGEDTLAVIRKFEPGIPIIGSSSTSENWTELINKGEANLVFIQKNAVRWDIPAILAKLAELNFHP